MAISPQGVAVPDLRGRIEQDAVNLIAAAGLTIGTRTEDFDPFIPAGSVVSNDPGPNEVVLPGHADQLRRLEGPRADADARADARPDARADAEADARAHAGADARRP